MCKMKVVIRLQLFGLRLLNRLFDRLQLANRSTLGRLGLLMLGLRQ